MKILFYFEANSTYKDRGFTTVETIAAVLIIGILASISAPSFVNWRRNQIMLAANNDISGEIRSVPDDARRWGASCSINLNRYIDGGKPIDINCVADGSEKSNEICARQTRCNIALSGKKVKALRTNLAGRNLVSIVSNVPNVSITPRGQLASTTDVLYVIKGTADLGGNPDRRCIVLKRITGEIKEGRYSGNLSVPGKGIIPVNQFLNPALCK